MAKQKEKKNITFEEKLEQALVPENEQPYELPKNWCWSYWGNSGTFIAGNAFNENFQGFTQYEIPYYKVGSLKNTDSNGYLIDYNNTINEEIRLKIKANIIPVNSVIFAKIGEAIRLNRRSINSVPCCIDNNLIAFVAKLTIYKYAYYWTKSIDLYQYANATTVPAIRKTDLEKLSFPLPPLPEQQRIVDLIERLFAKLDEAKEKVQTAIDNFELRKAAILHKAFTGELTRRWREEKEQNAESKRAGEQESKRAEERRAESGELGKPHFNKWSNETTGEDALKPLLEEGWLRSNRGGDGIRSKSCSIEQSSSQADWIATQSTTACNDDSTGGSDTLSLNKVYSSLVTTPTCRKQVTSPQGEALETADQTNANTTDGLPFGWGKVNLGDVIHLVQDKYNPTLDDSKISPLLKGNGCDSNHKPQGCGYASERQEVSESQGDFNKEEKISLSAKADIPLYERGSLENSTSSTVNIKYVGLEHIERNNGIIGYGSVDEVKSTKNVFKKGDLLYGKLRPYLNKHDVADFDGVCSTDILVYRTDEPTTAFFINYLFSTVGFIQYTVENSNGINLPRTSSKAIANYQIPLPPLAEQKEIVRILDTLLAKSDKAKELAENALENIETLKKTILAKAFRGLLGTNRPDEASSLELLKEVL